MMDFPILILQLRADEMQRHVKLHPDDALAKDHLSQLLSAIRTLLNTRGQP